MNPEQDYLAAVAAAEERLGIHHFNGVSWAAAPLPPRRHKCQPQTTGLGVKRCACGAIAQFGSSYWMERNSRRKDVAVNPEPRDDLNRAAVLFMAGLGIGCVIAALILVVAR